MRITPNTPPHIPETVLTSEMIKPYDEFYWNILNETDIYNLNL